MSSTSLSQALNGVPIICMTDGRVLAKLEDMLIDLDTRQVAALVTLGSHLSSHSVHAIPRAEVQVWGQDAVLVRRPDVIVQGAQLPGIEKWFSVSRQLKRCEVMGTDGTRIGVLDDVVIDTQGRIVGYDLSQVFVEGSVAYSRQVPAEATRSLDGNTLIVDVAQIDESASSEP